MQWPSSKERPESWISLCTLHCHAQMHGRPGPAHALGAPLRTVQYSTVQPSIQDSTVLPCDVRHCTLHTAGPERRSKSRGRSQSRSQELAFLIPGGMIPARCSPALSGGPKLHPTHRRHCLCHCHCTVLPLPIYPALTPDWLAPSALPHFRGCHGGRLRQSPIGQPFPSIGVQ